MTLLDRILARGVEMPMDPIVAARIERHLRRIQPDPLFRRRLRGQVLNRYVATREGLVPVTPAVAALRSRPEMGMLGRGVLFASLLTAASVTAVGAASHDSLPGDGLYGVKLQLEAIRMQVAPPGLRDDLAAMALDERLEEVERLAAAGRWQLVDEAADRVAMAQAQLVSVSGGSSPATGPARADEALERHADRLSELIATAPPSAKDGLERALQASTTHEPPTDTPSPPANAHAQGGAQSRTDGAAPPAPLSGPRDSARTPKSSD